MHANSKQATIERLTFLARNIINPDTGMTFDRPREIGDVFMLSDECESDFQALVKHLLDKEKWASKFSEKFVSDRLTDILHDAILPDIEATVAKGFTQLVDEFETFADKRIVLLPLVGILLHIPQLPIGRVVLRNVAGEEAKQLSDRIRSIYAQTAHSEEQKAAILKYI
jgi:hypothetical protein